MSRIVTTVITNTVAPAYANMLGFVCPKTDAKLVDNFELGLDYEGKEHMKSCGRLRC